MIAATPLKSLGWKRDLDEVRIVFRPGTNDETKIRFLANLIGSALLEAKAINGESLIVVLDEPLDTFGL